MDFFPLFAKLQDQPCLVVGGGSVACRKVRQLLKSGARVTVNSPLLNGDLCELVGAGTVVHESGPFRSDLVARHLLVIAATSNSRINSEIARTARENHRLCNVVDDGPASGFIMPAVLDRSPVVVAVSSGGRSPALARIIRQRIDEWLPSRIGLLAKWAAKWRERANRRIRTSEGRIRFWQRIFDGHVAQRVLAGRIDAADDAIAAAIHELPDRGRKGEAWIVGAGPGDPDLITRRGLQFLQRADVVLHDRLVASGLLEQARRDAEIICVGKSAGQASTRQSDINRQLVELVQSGKRVCRLKGGDPFVFGRGGEEAQALAQAGLPYIVVPGITAAIGCAAAAGIPLTHRDLSSGVTLVTGHRADQRVSDDHDMDWSGLAAARQTLVFYMAVRRLAGICGKLVAHGMAASTPAAVIRDGTTPQQEVVVGTLANLADRSSGITSPALLIVGEVAALADTLDACGRGPETSTPYPARAAT